MGMDVYKVPLTITSRFASTRTRWTHGPKALSTRGDGAAETTCDKAMCVGATLRAPLLLLLLLLLRASLLLLLLLLLMLLCAGLRVVHRVAAFGPSSVRALCGCVQCCCCAPDVLLRAVLRPHACPRQGRRRPTLRSRAACTERQRALWSRALLHGGPILCVEFGSLSTE